MPKYKYPVNIFVESKDNRRIFVKCQLYKLDANVHDLQKNSRYITKNARFGVYVYENVRKMPI